MRPSFYIVFPFLQWMGKQGRETLRHDLEAGFVGAVLVLPQAIALATLAGMPPEYGIYTSIIPVIIAALWGSSWHTVSGPNTALCVLILLSAAPLATAGTELYIAYVLAMTLLAGLIQLFIGVFRLGAVLDFISYTVVSAIILAVAMVILVSAATDLLGIPAGGPDSFIGRLIYLGSSMHQINPHAAMTGVVAVVAGLVARIRWRRYSLIVAMITGSGFFFLLREVTPAAVAVDQLGLIPVTMLPLSMPWMDLEDLETLRALAPSAISIAFLGLMQTVVISRSLGSRTGQQIDVNQEAIGQGLANIVAPFLSGFAGSGSFNRSAANLDAGARTPLASVAASLFLVLIVLSGSAFIAFLPIPVIAAVLVLVGLGLVNLRETAKLLRSRHEAIVFLVTFAAALAFSLNAGVLSGVLCALLIYLWLASTPNLSVETGNARDGRPLIEATIDGGLFFGSAHYVRHRLAGLRKEAESDAILLLHTDHMTYLDVPGATMLAEESRLWRDAGHEFYLFVRHDNILKVLETAGFPQEAGSNSIIHQEHPHPMKDILYPFRFTQKTQAGDVEKHEPAAMSADAVDIERLARRLRSTRLFGAFGLDQLVLLLQDSPCRFASAGDILVLEEEMLKGHILLIKGRVEVQRTWKTPESTEKSHTWTMEPGTGEDAFRFLGAATRGVRVRAVTDIRYIEIDADRADEFVSWSEEVSDELEGNPELRRRMELICHVSAFSHLPPQNVCETLRRFHPREVLAGETVITQGGKGDAYYVIEDGEAEVVRTDPFTDETEVVATLAAGDSFGEEALLQGGFRNATVTMITPGKLLVLQKADFDELIEPTLSAQIDAESANARLDSGQSRLIDCRYDMEFEDSRIPGATHISLDRLRWDVHKLDPEADYIVYCRSGRRSLAAAFLLRERNISAVSLKGGIKHWPYEVDTSPLTGETVADD